MTGRRGSVRRRVGADRAAAAASSGARACQQQAACHQRRRPAGSDPERLERLAAPARSAIGHAATGVLHGVQDHARAVSLWLVPRRRDGAEVIGEALRLAAGGAGHRVIARHLERPPGTVRGWLRAARRRAGSLRACAIRWTYTLDPEVGPVTPAGSELGDAIEAIMLAVGSEPLTSSLYPTPRCRPRAAPPCRKPAALNNWVLEMPRSRSRGSHR
jgi:hypothetical protein